jgi:hypothetical protein
MQNRAVTFILRIAMFHSSSFLRSYASTIAYV